MDVEGLDAIISWFTNSQHQVRNYHQRRREGRGHYGLAGRKIKILKVDKKLRPGAQNSGQIAWKLELIFDRN